MIKKEKKKTFYETELITEVTCDLCGKDLTLEDEEIVLLRMSHNYFQVDSKYLGDLETGYSRELCQECAKPIIDLIGGGLEVYL